jgi:hypothetical protein
LKSKIRMLPFILMLGLLAALPSLIPAHATGDFTVTASTANLGRIFADKIYNVTSTGGFSGTVSLSEYDNGGVTTSFNPTSVTVSSGGFATSGLSISVSCSAGRPPLTVQGTSGSLVHYVNISWGIIVC